MEIFTTFGTIKFCDFGTDRLNNNKGYCFIEFNSSEDAENAMKNMDGGQIDGQEITCAPVLAAPRPPRRIPRRSPMIRRSPPRWGGGGGGRGRFVLRSNQIYTFTFLFDMSKNGKTIIFRTNNLFHISLNLVDG
jgi:RNA recognition motif-containing protein